MVPAVQLNKVTKTIKNRKILSDINLTIDYGKVVGIVGHNGSGKSILFRLISGLVKPTIGEIIVHGETLHKKASFASNTSFILEKPGFLEQYSGFDNLKFLADIKRKINSEQIGNTIKRVGLDPEDRKPVKTYSLGMKQKLAIAQAIMEQPELILLDEPMNGLDEDSVEQMYNIIREENQRGATILISSHHKIDIETLCQQVYKVNAGTISELS
ncbi:ABC transporter ATP-binding protein [Paenibacillus sp. YYML68]|uniref:ABC transporter ATP-binding protein n=1 Tax=Paenibacillus sp. YYML68 TaxID=2909250 RepID=UPI00248F6ADF|nr:ABC transporter ATP-binding protein [Paenibacillus sp. YYML68]